MLRAFIVGFLKFLRVVFYFRGSARFNRHSCTVASLTVPAMIAYNVATKVLDTE